MTERVVAVFARPSPTLPTELSLAMLSDVVDLVADTPQVESALVVAEGYDGAAALTWPGTRVVQVSSEPTVAEALQAGGPAIAVAVVVPDAPDLPTLLLGKLFSALTGRRGAALAICPAEGGGLVAAAAPVPLAGWVAALAVGFDDTDAVEALEAAAPPGGLSIGPGWHRVREIGDTARLDPGLEGWDATRAYLG
jgi:2-phospho-L-lactate guanylyltransferase (CobY/MobA/RfbA family)